MINLNQLVLYKPENNSQMHNWHHYESHHTVAINYDHVPTGQLSLVIDLWVTLVTDRLGHRIVCP